MRAGSPDNCGDWNTVRASGKAVASSGPVSKDLHDRRDRSIAVLGDIGGVQA